MNPAVSVVIPVFNCERYVAAALESVLAQTFADFEVIIVDDGSRDGSIDICRGYRDSRIRIVSQPNRGLAGARNTGIRNARGRFIAFLDADDYWAADKLEHQVQRMEADPQLGLSYCCSAFIDEQGRRIGIYQTAGLQQTTLALCLTRNPLGNGSTPLIRAEVFDPNHPNNSGSRVDDFYFDEQLRRAEDFELWVRIVTQTRWRVECVPRALTYYRINTAGLSSNVPAQRGYHFLALTKIHRYAPEAICRYRTTNLAYFYLYLGRILLFQRRARRSAECCKVAYRYSPAVVARNGVLLTAAAQLQSRLPGPVYQTLETTGFAAIGTIQQFKMWRRRAF